MNKTIFQLAYRQVKIHKSQYLFMCIFIFVMTLAFHTYIIGTQSYHQMHKVYNEKYYGSWYIKYNVQKVEFDLLKEEIADNQDIEYHFMYMLGQTDDGFNIGFGDEGFYDFCAITLKEGHFPLQDNEIVVSDDLSYKINDLVEVDILGTKKMKVVGIVHNSQNLFCDIYTLPQDDYEEVIMYCDSLYDSPQSLVPFHDSYYIEENANVYGYNHNEAWNDFYTISANLGVFLQAGLLIAVSLIALTTTLLKRRVKEFALLRGIGMTTKQLFLMEMYEIALCSVLSILSATLLAPLLSYLIVYYISLSQECFIYVFSLPTYLFYTFILFLSVLCFFIYPARKSSSQALNGTFDHAQFKYFDVRINQFKYLYKWRIAWREWKTHKKMNILFIVLICLCSVPLLINQIIRGYKEEMIQPESYIYDCKNTYYFEVEGDINQLKQIEQLDFPEIDKYSYQNAAYESPSSSSSSSQMTKLNDELMKKAQIEGTYPQKENEVLVNEYANIAIGDTVKIENHDFYVTGIVQSYTIEGDRSNDYNSFDYQLINGEIFMTKEAFDKMFSSSHPVLCIWYDDFEERDQYLQMIEDNDIGGISIYDMGLKEFTRYNGSIEEIPLLVDNEMMIVGLIMFFILCYYLNKNYLINHQRDYMMMRIVGMTKREMLIKEVEKGFYSFVIINIMNITLILLVESYLQIVYIPIVEFLVMSFICLGICVVIYMMPLYVLWNDLMNIDNGGGLS